MDNALTAPIKFRPPRADVVEVADGPGSFADWLRATTQDLPDGLTFDEWKEWGQQLRGRQEKLTWKIVQWLMYGEKKYGETYLRAAQETGYGNAYLRELKWIGQSTMSVRTDIPAAHNLSPARLKPIAPLPPEHQKRLVKTCLKDGMTHRQFVQHVKDYCVRQGLAPAREEATLRIVSAPPAAQYASIRLPADVYQRLEQMAEADGETPESWIASFVERMWRERENG